MVILLLLSLMVKALTQCPLPPLRQKSFSFFTHICWKLLLAFLDSVSPLNAATDFALDLGFICMYVFILCDSPWPCSSPGAALIRSEVGRELSLRSRLLLWSLPKPFPVTSNRPEESYKLQTHSRGTCLGQEKGNDPSLLNDLWEKPWKGGWVVQQREMPWNLAVSRFLLAVILVSGFETAVQSQLLTVWVAVCWWWGIISPTKFPPDILSGIVSEENKEKKCHSYLLPRSFGCFSNYHCSKGSDLAFHKNTQMKHIKFIFGGPRRKMTLDAADGGAGPRELSFSSNSTVLVAVDKESKWRLVHPLN